MDGYRVRPAKISMLRSRPCSLHGSRRRNRHRRPTSRTYRRPSVPHHGPASQTGDDRAVPRATGQGLSSKEVFERMRDLSSGSALWASRRGSRRHHRGEPARMAARAISRSWRPGRSRCRSIRRCRRRRRATSSTTPARGLPWSRRVVQLEKLQEVRHLLPALEAVVVMDPAAGAQRAFGACARRRSNGADTHA